MGKKEQRFMRVPPPPPRSRRDRDYEWSPPRETCRDPETVVWQDSVPMWEKKFCFLSGISWEKVLIAKKAGRCHSPVLEWDDAAGEEAFRNAKERFHAKINGLPCENQLPDPDMHIDVIDWNPIIDDELVLDLEQDYFNPEEGENNTSVEDAKDTDASASAYGLEEQVKNSDHRDDPWEHCINLAIGERSEKAVCWNRWV